MHPTRPARSVFPVVLALWASACSGAQGDEDGGGDTSNDTNITIGDMGEPEPCESDEDCPADEPICDELTGDCYAQCSPGDVMACYNGPEGTVDVGKCEAGIRTCNGEGRWNSDCLGEVQPDEQENCGNGIDDDCDGAADDDDLDGDGFTQCSGDCCDSDGINCISPELVNPGAFEVVGNRVDDDCDGEIDEVEPACDEGLASDSEDPLEFARAMELCAVTEEEPDLIEDKTWGVISGGFSQADGEQIPVPEARAIREGFGDNISPEANSSMVVLSTGHAAAPGQTNPAFSEFEFGTEHNLTSEPPADWFAANDGMMPTPPQCDALAWNLDANDSMMLKLRIRVPTNARSFSMKMFFLSAEWPEFVCSPFNDFFVTLVDTTAEDHPDDKNIASYDDGEEQYPIAVNLAAVAGGLFRACENGEIGCQGNSSFQYGDCEGTDELVGTGFDIEDQTNSCGHVGVGGGTGWLTMNGNVTPGEIIELRFAIWDASGFAFDSVVILDAFEWSLDAAQPGVSIG